MRNTLFNIFLLLTACILCSAEGCESEQERVQREQKELQASVDATNESLRAEMMTDAMKIAFEEKGMHKLIDAAESFSYYSNTSLDDVFRRTSFGMLIGLFDSREDTITLLLDTMGRITRIPLYALAKTLNASSFDAMILTIDSVNVAQPLQRINDTTAAGILECVQHWKGIHAGDTISLGASKVLCEMYARKAGWYSDGAKHWKVLLGGFNEKSKM